MNKKTILIGSILVMTLLFFSVMISASVFVGQLIPNNEIAEKMAKAPENSPVITGTVDGWALPVKTFRPCPPDKFCI